MATDAIVVIFHVCVCVFACDKSNVCKHVADSRNHHLFSSAQCLGYSFEFGHVTDELCFPSKDVILNQVKQAVDRLDAVAVFVASDRDAMIAEFQQMLKRKVSCLFLYVIQVVFGHDESKTTE